MDRDQFVGLDRGCAAGSTAHIWPTAVESPKVGNNWGPDTPHLRSKPTKRKTDECINLQMILAILGNGWLTLWTALTALVGLFVRW